MPRKDGYLIERKTNIFYFFYLKNRKWTIKKFYIRSDGKKQEVGEHTMTNWGCDCKGALQGKECRHKLMLRGNWFYGNSKGGFECTLDDAFFALEKLLEQRGIVKYRLVGDMGNLKKSVLMIEVIVKSDDIQENEEAVEIGCYVDDKRKITYKIGYRKEI